MSFLGMHSALNMCMTLQNPENLLELFYTLWTLFPDFPIKRFYQDIITNLGFPSSTAVKNLPTNSGDIRDASSIPGLGRSPEGGHGNPLQYPCLENPMDRGAWWASPYGCKVLDTNEVTEHAHVSPPQAAVTHVTTSSSCDVKQLSRLFSTNALGKSLFPLSNIWVTSVNDKTYKWGFSRELPNWPNSDNFLVTGLRNLKHSANSKAY